MSGLPKVLDGSMVYFEKEWSQWKCLVYGRQVVYLGLFGHTEMRSWRVWSGKWWSIVQYPICLSRDETMLKLVEVEKTCKRYWERKEVAS